jgi:serine/threonine-protein kinase
LKTFVPRTIPARRAIRIVLLLVVLFLARNYILRLIQPASAPLPAPVQSTLGVPADRALDALALSPDGRWLAYAAEATDAHLFVRPVDESGDREVADSGGATNPFFSADGESIAYFARGAIWKARTASGGTPQRVCDAPVDSAGGTWTGDGRIVFAPLGGLGLMTVPAAGGTPAPITTLNKKNAELAHGWPHALPAGGIVFTVSHKGRDAHLETLSASNVRGRELVPVFGQAEYVSTGHLVYSYLGDLLAVPFDADGLTARGVPVALVRGIQSSTEYEELGHSGFAVSPNGTLVWLPTSVQHQQSSLVRVDLQGAITPLGGPADVYQTPRVSPDGRRLAVVVRSGLMTRDIRVLDAAHPDRVQLTIQGGDNQSPAWIPDGRLSFASNRDGGQRIYVLTVEGSKQGGQSAAPAAKPLFSADVSSPRNPASWRGPRRGGGDGESMPSLLAFYEIDQFRGRDVLVYRVGEAILPVAATSANERSPWLAPDGRSIAYVSDASGRDEVYVKQLPPNGESSEARQVSSAGGTEPVWSKAGLLYRERDRVLLEGKVLFEGRFEHDPAGNAANYDVDPKGRFLVMLKRGRYSGEMRLVKNWGTNLIQQARSRNQ